MVSTAASVPLSESHQGELLKHYGLICKLLLEKEEEEEEEEENSARSEHGDGIFCPGLWDGILCWDRTPAGQLSIKSCPSYIAGFNTQWNATRLCLADGTWFRSEDTVNGWSNYTQCSSEPGATAVVDLTNRQNLTQLAAYVPAIKTITEVGYGVSLVSLTVAFLILAGIKKLRCPRNRLHMHLFGSFIMRAFMSLLKHTLFVLGVGLSSDIFSKGEHSYFNNKEELQENWPCKLITSLWQYFILANYSWILMEGLYLHNLIFLALFSDSSSITLYIILGWGLPALFVLPWTLCRATLENTLCWTTNQNKYVFSLITVPIIVSIIVNFILFLNIIRVLFLKLKSSVCDETKTYRRWAKSTLVLVPLFGVHYMLFLGLQYYPKAEVVFLFCNQLFGCFQGFFVAILYCFLNGEVRAELSKKWSHFSFSELLERLPFSGHDNMSNGILTGGGRFLAKGRHNHPRASCYSSTSFTSVSVLPAGHCCNLNKKRATGGGVAEAPPQGPRAAGVVRAALHGSYHGGLANVQEAPDSAEKDSLEIKDETSKGSQDRRWSESDYNLENNAMELRSITSPNNFSVKL